MLHIGPRPMVWHIMKYYSHYGFHDFVLCLGYKGWLIKEFFLNYHARTSDITVNLNHEASVTYHHHSDEARWSVTLADTGEDSLTGRRVALIKPYLMDDERFGLTYGDGLADIDLADLASAHRASGLKATISGVHPSGRFGEMEYANGVVTEFNEKPNVGSGLINGGFMIFERDTLDTYFDPSQNQILERDVIPCMVKDRQVGIYAHEGFWQCMDTPREYAKLNSLWNEGKAPWKLW